MNQVAILWPVVALVALTFFVGGLTLNARLRAAFAKRVGPKDFRYGESDAVPADVALLNRNYMNLLELPVLFYVVCIALYVTKHVSIFEVTLAWLFVLARIIHSGIHLTSNNVLHRMLAFNAGSLILLLLWVLFAVAIV